ncbi:type II secretion system F family protein, partial [Elusimicrobiota bacterium]
GGSLSEALKKHSQVFNRFFVSMVEAGEESGSLDIVLQDLSAYLEHTVKLQRKVKAASTYPVFITGFFVTVVAGIVLFLIPKFKELFSSLGVELPMLTKVVMGISGFFVNYFYITALIGIGLGILFTTFYRTEKGRYQIESTLLVIPLFGILMTKVILTRFFQTLSTLLKNGVDIVASLEIAGRVVNNVPVEKIINDIKIRIMEGSSLASEMNKYPIFPKMSVRMAAIGERSGKIDEMLSRVSEYFNDEVDATVEGLSSIIEPFLIIILGVVVGFFIIAMYLPVFRMAMGMLGGGSI